jgi:hypothetical protein
MKSLPFIVLLLFVNAVNSQIEVMKKPKKDTLFRNKAYGFLNITNVNRTLIKNLFFWLGFKRAYYKNYYLGWGNFIPPKW